MIRYFLAKGDRAGSAMITEGLTNVTCSNPPPRVQIATLYMKTFCTACKREGFISPKGPRQPGNGPNGQQWALSGDINVCGCNPPPVFYAERGMKMTIRAEEMVGGMGSGAGAQTTATSIASDADYDEQIRFVTPEDVPLARMRYRIFMEDGNQHSGITDDNGLTERICTNRKLRMVRVHFHLDTDEGEF